MKDIKYQVVLVIVSLLGATVSVFAISDRFVTIREWQQALMTIDTRLERIEQRMDAYGFPKAQEEAK